MAQPPGSRLPAAAEAALASVDPYRWMTARWRRYGDVFTVKFPIFGEITYAADPDGVRELFGGDPDTHRAGEANANVLGPVLGASSLLTLDGSEHLRHRRLVLPPFHGERVRNYAQLVADITEAEIARWPLDRPFQLRPAMQRITLEVILRAVFGVRGEERLKRFRTRLPRLMEVSNAVVFFPALRRDLGPWSPWTRFTRARDAVDELFHEEIALHRDAPDLDERDDVLSLLLCARDEDGQPLTDSELRDELLTLLAAGHETTATGLSWAFERLVRTPQAMAAAVDSLDGDDAYLEAVTKETLRVRPVIIDVARKLSADSQLRGHDLPAGTLAMAAIAVLHRRPDLWDRPLQFRPERFLEAQPAPYSWIPFGGGVRRCIGASFAQMEMRVVLRSVLERLELRAVREEAEHPRLRHVTVVPGRGAEVVAKARVATSRRNVSAAAASA